MFAAGFALICEKVQAFRVNTKGPGLSFDEEWLCTLLGSCINYQQFELYCLLVATPELFSFYKSELTLDILFPKANNKSDSVLNFVQTFPNLIQYHCFLVWSYMTKIHFSFDSITIPFHWTFFVTWNFLTVKYCQASDRKYAALRWSKRILQIQKVSIYHLLVCVCLYASSLRFDPLLTTECQSQSVEWYRTASSSLKELGKTLQRMFRKEILLLIGDFFSSMNCQLRST